MKENILLSFISFCVVMISISITVFAQSSTNLNSKNDIDNTYSTDIEAHIVDSGSCGENLTWTLTDDGLLTISGTGAMNDWGNYDYNINGYTTSPWYNNEHIKQIIIEEGATNIGNYAFHSCSELIRVTIPNSVTSIGNEAFRDCYWLETITIPDSVISIGDAAFMQTELRKAKIPDNIINLGSSVFQDCRELTSVKIPDSVTNIGQGMFNGCDNLTDIYYSGSKEQWENITIDSSNEQLDSCVIHFNSDGSDSGICGDDLTWTLTYEGSLIISGTGKMNDYKDAYSDENVPISPWYANEDIREIIIDDGVTSIGNWAFVHCSNLSSIKISDGVIDIGEYAFFYCRLLTDIKIPNSVISIGDSAFNDCYSLVSIEIPNSVTNIGDYIFAGCSDLTSVEIPDSITNISKGMFSGCYKLTNIKIPNSVTYIGDYAFSTCDGLTSVIIPDGVTEIGHEAFAQCSELKSISIPDSVISIGAWIVGSWMHQDCGSLSDIYYFGTKEQWENIDINPENCGLYSATIHYNSTNPADKKISKRKN